MFVLLKKLHSEENFIMKYDCEIPVHDILGRQKGKQMKDINTEKIVNYSFFFFYKYQLQKEIQCVKLFNILMKEIGVH